MMGSMGAISSGSTESDLLALIRLLADPDATQARLEAMHDLKFQLADAYKLQAETKAQIESEATEVQARATSLDELAAKLIEQSKALDKRERHIKAGEDKLRADTAERKAGLDSRESAVSDRETAVFAREHRIDEYAAQAKADRDVATALRAEYEGKLAKLKAAVG